MPEGAIVPGGQSPLFLCEAAAEFVLRAAAARRAIEMNPPRVPKQLPLSKGMAEPFAQPGAHQARYLPSMMVTSVRRLLGYAMPCVWLQPLGPLL